jgi:CHAT domain-containing protein/tetratricopeptide (TPR) repeat protein
MSWIRLAAWSFPFFTIFIIVHTAAVRAQTADIIVLNRQSLKLHKQGKDKEATAVAEEAVELAERAFGPDQPETLKSLYNLASLYEAQGLYGKAEPLFKRALAGFERTFGNEAPSTLSAISNLASLYEKQGLYAEAEPLFKRALDGLDRTRGPEDLQTLISANNLGSFYRVQGRYAEAAPLYQRVSAGFERLLGPEHPDTLASLSNLAQLSVAQGRYGEAEPIYKHVLEGRERVLGPDHPETLRTVANLASLRFNLENWAGAVELWRRSTTAIAGRTLRGAQDIGQAPTEKPSSEAEEASSQFRSLMKAAYRLTPQGGMPDAELSHEMFQTGQWVQIFDEAQWLGRMAAQAASSNPALAGLLHDRQALVEEWRKRDREHNAALNQAPENRATEAEAGNMGKLAAIDARIKQIDKELAAKFPDYAELMNPAPISVEDIQALLGDDEALVLFLDTGKLRTAPEESFIWVVTKTASRWVRSALGTQTLTKEVQALRCGLDAAAWEGPRCEQLTGQHYTGADRNAGKPLPFDYGRAHRLYQGLFGQVEDLIKDKHLLIVPTGPFTQLPFQVLLTAPMAPGGDDKSAAWLIRNHAISVLPAASSLKALRRLTPPNAEKPVIGFGNPLLDGPDGAYVQRAKEARDEKTCGAISKEKVASVPPPGSIGEIQMIGGLADVSFLRKLAPLPETAGELCAVARDVHAEPRDIYLGARAMEHVVKRLSDTGELAKYRIAHFATHCALPGDTTSNAEPGLILTPPDTPSKADDGYLTASEIAALKLDADWVILSACNTGAEDAPAAEALSRLARAFILAQARALLVSHWETNPEATVKLITGAINRLAADSAVGRAEAMRQSMLDLIDHGEAEEAHPAIWAPFVVVGEGGAGR